RPPNRGSVASSHPPGSDKMCPGKVFPDRIYLTSFRASGRKGRKVMVQQPIRGRVHGFRGIAALGIVLFTTQSFLPAQTPDKEILTILQRCYQCHGETLQMSKLDLRTRPAMLKGGASGPAIVPGDAAASLLYKRVTGQQQPIMPMAPAPAL